MMEKAMRKYEYFESPKKYFTPQVVPMLTEIYEHKGRQQLFVEAAKDELSTLLEVAKIQSAASSNRIEGIFSSDKRLREIVEEKSEPQNRSEQEIAGYREVLSEIHKNYDYINLTPNVILQLHRDLYSFSDSAIGGKWKAADNAILEVDADGKERVRFQPVSAFETAMAMEELCAEFNRAMEKRTADPLILISMFILDFLCVHPFSDGNGRMSRLLTLLLFYKNGFIVGKYLSVEMLIEKSKETYYDSLHASSRNWHENANDYEPFISYYLGVLLKAYDEFEARVEHLKDRTISKPDRIKKAIDRRLGKISKKEIMDFCPDISQVTVERTLTALVKSGYIRKVGAGKKTEYVKVD